MPISRERSQAQFQRALKSIPGGVNSPARAFGGVGGEPLFIQRGDGTPNLRLRQRDDNRFGLIID